MNKFEKFSQNAGKLSLEEMKQVKGGACGYSYTAYNENGTPYPVVNCSTNQSFAMEQAAAHGGNWCCSSCGTSTYCGGGNNP
jgi:natural product precursor